MLRKSIARLTLLTAALALAVAGCSSGGGTSPSGSGAPTAAQTGSTPADASGAGKMLGLITFSGTDPSAMDVINKVQSKAEAQGYKVQVVDANGQVDLANSAIQNLVQAGAAAIGITVFPSDSLAAGLASAKEAKVPVVTMGGGLADGITFNIDDSQGQVVTQKLIDDMGGKGEVLTLTYLGGRPCQLRLAAFETTVEAKAPDLKITKQAITVPGQVESATQATIAWLAAHPEGSAESFAIYACFDDPALGAIAALVQNERTDVKVYGFNGVPPALQAVKDGTLTGTLWFDHEKIGDQFLEQLIRAINNPGVAPEDVLAPSIVVTKDNYEQFAAEHPEALTTS